MAWAQQWRCRLYFQNETCPANYNIYVSGRCDSSFVVWTFYTDILLNRYNFAYKQNLALSLEQSYRDVLIFPLLKACVNILNNDNLVFVPGEVPLNSMTAQLTNSKKVLAPSEKYYADGIVLYMNNEICIYEGSGPFGAKEKSKQNFDFHKALYGLLSCITIIAQSNSYASLKTFSKLKLHFVQTKGMMTIISYIFSPLTLAYIGSTIHLWYLRHPKENTYAIVRESKLNSSNEKEKYADTVLDCLQFTGLFKITYFEVVSNLIILTLYIYTQ